MTHFHAGIAQTRCQEHPRAAEIDLTARAVLAAAGWFVGEKGRGLVCYASQTTIGAKAGCHRTVAHKALNRLAELGLITRVDARPGVPVHWRLVILEESARVAESDRSATADLSRSTTGPVSEDDTPCSGERHNPSDLSRPPGREKRGRSDSASRTASADAAAAAAPRRDERPTEPEHIRYVMDGLGLDRDAAEAWAGQKVAGRGIPPGRVAAYVIQCVANDLAAATTSAASRSRSTPTGKSAKGKGGRSAAKGAATGAPAAAPRARRRSWPHLTDQEQGAAFETWAAGGDLDALASELNLVPHSLGVQLGREAQNRALRAALDTGDVEGAVREWRALTLDGKPAVTLAGVGSRFDRERAFEVEELLLLDYPLAQLADVFCVDVDQVRTWALTRPRAAARVSPVPLSGVAAAASLATGELDIVPASAQPAPEPVPEPVPVWPNVGGPIHPAEHRPGDDWGGEDWVGRLDQEWSAAPVAMSDTDRRYLQRGA